MYKGYRPSTDIRKLYCFRFFKFSLNYLFYYLEIVDDLLILRFYDLLNLLQNSDFLVVVYLFKTDGL